MTFAEKLRGMRKDRNLTQADVAGLAQVQPLTVSRWERGEIQPHPLMQDAVMARLGATPRKETRGWLIMAQDKEGNKAGVTPVVIYPTRAGAKTAIRKLRPKNKHAHYTIEPETEAPSGG